MNCAEITKHLSEYLDNEADAGLREQIDAHLAECSACRQKLAELQALSRSLASLDAELPMDFTASFTEKLAAEETRKTSARPFYRRTWFKTASVAACLLICLGAVGLLAGHGKNGDAAPMMPMAADMEKSSM